MDSNSTLLSVVDLLEQEEDPVQMVQTLVDVKQPSFLIAIASMALVPIYWNIIARTEHKTRWLSKLCRSPYIGCYLLAITIFLFSGVRDYLFQKALLDQVTVAELGIEPVTYLSYALYSVGMLLVLTSFYQLGITGTYLGDYFGILMDARVTAFPFNIMDNPMYNGATMLFAATSIQYQSVAGLVLTLVAYIVYRLALFLEQPYTTQIYANKARKNSTQQKKHRKSKKA